MVQEKTPPVLEGILRHIDRIQPGSVIHIGVIPVSGSDDIAALRGLGLHNFVYVREEVNAGVIGYGVSDRDVERIYNAAKDYSWERGLKVIEDR